MKKITSMISLGFLLLYACTSATTVPINEIKTTNTATLTPTQVFTQTPTFTLTPNIEPIVGGWNTFFSPQFGFSLQYPAVYDKGFQSFEFTCNFVVQQGNDKLHMVVGDIQVFGEITNKKLDEYVKFYIENNRQGWDVKLTEIETSGLVAKSLEYHQASPPRGGDVTIIVNNDRAIVIQYFDTNFINCDPKDDKHSSYWVYEQMIISLRFHE